MKYKFRGLNISTGKWVYGNLLRQNNGSAYILPVDKSWFRADQVHPETVGQFTGLHDRNGREIYEGDNYLHDESLYLVVWDKKQSRFSLQCKNRHKRGLVPRRAIRGEIIGTIHDKEVTK